ncbi:DNA replication complex GINS protein PSF1 [Jimgerdemannia flammicorona]|uniref:DNA replication complex GINS protein PSF1 n=1 Tax=Jimgerdemannia flammicorona TaxID=994334 RepID=A0A433DHU1_9FUNG|nr:DNA replication complex GINS protein PSF1 [Jimgerdemannia flammicorona]
MSMYGDEAYKLAKEAKRTTDILPPYNDELVRSVSREIRALSAESDAMLTSLRARGATYADDPGAACAVLVQQLAAKRDKRCLFAYHRQRLERVKELVWEAGPAGVQREVKRCASATELEFFDCYKEKVVGAYKHLFTEVDLLGGGLDPPKDLFIESVFREEDGRGDLDKAGVLEACVIKV